MKRLLKLMICTFIFVFFPFLSTVSAVAPYNTYTVAPDGYITNTQTVYEPLGTLLGNAEIDNPEDIFIDDEGILYVVDSGTKKIIMFDNQGTVLNEFGEDILGSPTGIFVDGAKDIYIADYGKEKIFHFSNQGDLKQEYGRPDSPLFGKRSPFKPQKVGVDRRGNIYVIGEGSTNGIIQMSQSGEFLGYYGVNRAQLSFGAMLRKLITTDEARSRLFMKTPPAPDNIAIDEQGLIYSITRGTNNEIVKKLNVAGQNMFPEDIYAETNLVDISIDKDGNIFTITATGEIYEYNSYGELLFVFGGLDDGSNRLGLFKQPSGIAVDEEGRLYVTDKELGIVKTFERTTFSQLTHAGIALYKEGLYVESQHYWEEVLQLNASFGLAYSAMGKAYYKQQQYEEALTAFEFANDVEGYSDAFWEVRHAWLQDNLGMVIVISFILFVIYSVIKYLDKKKHILNGVRKQWKKVSDVKLISELLFIFRFFRHPIDSFFDLQRLGKASVLSASIWYVILFAVFLINRFQTGFIFSSTREGNANLLFEFGIVFVPLLAFIIVNFLVSTINDGEGRFRDIYIGTIYAFAPYLVLSLPVTLLSNGLTLNEAFIYNFAMLIIYSWCLIILFIMVKEIHNFTISGTLGNILVTLFGMVILLLVVMIIFILIDQVYDFVNSIIREVMLRV